jgi:DMSO/TMAO reductase YedYZ molybdopterin-dependent catalytic subunit
MSVDHPDVVSNIGARRPVGPGVVIGLVCGAVAIGFAQLVAGIVDPDASPIVTVGGSAIDATPEWLKSFAIRTFGTSDKLVLLIGIAVVLTACALVIGILAVRRPWVGFAGLAAFGLTGVAAAASRPTAEGVDVLPAVAGAAAAGITLILLLRAGSLRGETSPAATSTGPTVPGGMDRRRFFLAGAAGAAAAVLAGGAGNLFARRFEADASRAAVRIPSPVGGTEPPAGLDLRVKGLSPFFTPNDVFYRVDTALLVPAVKAEDWRLRVHGMVEQELTITYGQLLARPMIERDITLTCVSNEVGGEYVGNARWIGARLKDLLDEAGVDPAADQIVTRSVDGFTAGTPTALALDGRDAMLAIAMNGEPLPLAHGFPVRSVVPGLYGYVSATKWLEDIELTTFDAFDPYWVRRGWAEQAPIKTESRIDTPAPSQRLGIGLVPVAGVAWAQHRGIGAVDVRVDGGPWMPAELSPQDTIDTWRQWLVMWDASAGEHELQVRATDQDGAAQTEDRAAPFPDGATGFHTVVVNVS